jgi:hypothetical protein
MPTTTTTEAGRVVASNMHARRQQAAAEARAASAELFPVDTTTPLVGKAPLETLPEPPAPAAEPAKAARSIALATMITYRDYEITVTATGFTLDQFCDMLDKRLGVESE